MTSKMKHVLDNFHKYNVQHAANINFGLEENIVERRI